MTANEKYNGSVLTTGVTLRLAKGAVLKADIDYARTMADAIATTTFNAGMGIMF